jgi:hypothetical protein
MGPARIDAAKSWPTREEMRAMSGRRNNLQRRLRWPGSLIAALATNAAAHAHRARRRLRRNR